MIDEKYYIDEKATVLEAMQAINSNGIKTLFVTEKNKLKGSVTDGDARRWIVSGGDIGASITNIVNYNPKYLEENTNINPIEFMRKNSIEAIPIVKEDMTIADIISWADRVQRGEKKPVNLPVVIMAGGKGTRLYPYTQILPKPLIPVGEYPIVQRIIDEFCKYDCNEYYMIVNHKKNMIKAYFNEIETNYQLKYIDEEVPLGTGGGLRLLKEKIDQTFILTNCDIMVTADIAEICKVHKKKKNIITMVCCNKTIEVPYGVIEVDRSGNIKNMVEKPHKNFLTNTGLYIVEPEVIDYIEDNVFVGFPDVIQVLMDKGEKVGVYTVEENDWLDMGQFEEFERMKQYIEG